MKNAFKFIGILLAKIVTVIIIPVALVVPYIKFKGNKTEIAKARVNQIKSFKAVMNAKVTD